MGEDTGNDKPEEHQEEQVSPSLNQDVVTTPTVVQEQPTPPPEFAPAAGAVAPSVRQSDPITLVLQWLTYAFWGWFALAMLWLSFQTFSFFTDPSSQSDGDWSTAVAYPIAAVVVLFLMAAATDLFYRRREPAHKTGIATAIMVIHTVIFALCGVGLVVTVVFTVLQLMLSTSTDEWLFALLYMALVGVLIYVILVARTTLVAKLKRVPVIAMGSLGAIALIFVVLCVTGPMMRSLATKQDRQVGSALSEIQSSIVDYTRDNKKLPTSLNNLSFNTSYSDVSNADIQALLNKGLIEYTPDVKSPSKSNYGLSQDDYMRSLTVTHYYRLCATYTSNSDSGTSSNYRSYSSDSIDYNDGDSASSDSDSINANPHKVGKQCYDLRVSSNDYSSVHPVPMPIRN